MHSPSNGATPDWHRDDVDWLTKGDQVYLKVSRSPLHGQGCFATRDIGAGEVVAKTRLLIFPPDESEQIMRTRLKDYLFYVRDGADPAGPDYLALAMGPVSFCNHSSEANCAFDLDEAAAEITLTARRPLRENEEITIDYGDYAEKII